METLAQLYEQTIRQWPDAAMASFVNGTGECTYAEFAAKCEKMSEALSRCGIGAGDKVMILSENMPNWTVGFFSATVFGRIAVPVLPDSSPNEVNNIIVHSEAKALFASSRQIAKISPENREQLRLIVNTKDLEIESMTEAETPAATSVPGSEDLAAIIYTSGTSGKAKGVMLAHRAFIHNCTAAVKVLDVSHDDTWLSILPMAHTYEMTLGMVAPFFMGAKVWYLGKAPTASVLMPAMAKVKPTLIPSVPLILEKVYRRSVLPKIQKSAFLSKMHDIMPGVLYYIIGIGVKKAFGGRLRTIGIGGAKLDSEVETFLHKARFPYAIGYGMTECCPLICLAAVGKTKVGSTGVALPGVDVKILNPDPVTGEGEIVVKGPNVMLGYYKDPERTAAAFTEDGWMRTNDLAVKDARGRYFIKGRLGNMILGPSGENIYPEEIEMVINGLDGVEESLVMCENGRLIALVKMIDGIKGHNDELQKKANVMLNKASQINEVRIHEEPFVKTATNKIRRFLYTGEKKKES